MWFVNIIEYSQFCHYDSAESGRGNLIKAHNNKLRTPKWRRIASAGAVSFAMTGKEMRSLGIKKILLIIFLSINLCYATTIKIAIGVKVDNLGKEFAQSTDIPVIATLGAKLTLPKNFAFLIESKYPDLEINSGLLYQCQAIQVLFGS